MVVSSSIPELMFKVLRLIHNRKRDGFTVRLSPPEFIALKFFEENSAATPTLLAAHLDIRKPTASSLIQKLMGRGLLIKQSNQKDSRSFHVVLTEQGKSELKKTEAEFSQFADPIFGVLSDKEKEVLKELFQKIISHHSHE